MSFLDDELSDSVTYDAFVNGLSAEAIQAFKDHFQLPCWRHPGAEPDAEATQSFKDHFQHAVPRHCVRLAAAEAIQAFKDPFQDH